MTDGIPADIKRYDRFGPVQPANPTRWLDRLWKVANVIQKGLTNG